MMGRPRPFWSSMSDAELIEARDEYRAKAVTCPELLAVADDIDDDLRRRVHWREVS